jgi:hypothetical protein
MSQTRQIRRPALKLVPTTPGDEPNKASRIVHDARGTAVWVGEPPALDDVSALTLVLEPNAPRATEGDPYNRPAGAFGPRAATPLRDSPFKRRR